MANINFNNIYRRANDSRSAVDSTLLTRTDLSSQETFSDIRFDLRFKEITEKHLYSKENDNDIQKIVDEESVITSVKNIIHTAACSRLLNPEIDMSLVAFLFEPINQHTAYFIGYTLNNLIPAYEPRVTVENIEVVGYPDKSLYEASIVLFIPALKKYVDFAFVLEEEYLSEQ